MKYLIYILAMTPIIWIIPGLGSSFDPYDDLLAETGRWMMIWFIVLLSLGPVMRSFRIKSVIIGKQPLGLAVFSWAVLHVISYFTFHASPLGTALLELAIRPFLVLGVVAFLILAALAATSHQRAIRWLRKKWNILHKLSLWAGAIGAAHGLVAQKVALNEFGVYALLILILLFWRGVTNWRKA